MLYLLLGKDDFTKKEFLTQLRQKEKFSSTEYFYDWDQRGIESAISGGSGLFGGKKLIVINGQIGKFDFEEFMQRAVASDVAIAFVEESLDKRKTETKNILKHKDLEVKEFEIPVGIEFRKWVEVRAKTLQIKFEKQALELFLKRMGIEADFGEQLYSLWQVDSELSKLKTFAQKEITVKDIERLVSENISENIFKITNAIADKNKKQAIKQLVDYMDRLLSGDEKSKIISLSGIIAEQFRGILVIQNLLNKRMPDAQILKLTGYSSGRIFVYKKIAVNFEQRKIYDALRKLELLDEEIKTSSGPAGLQFFMIVNSVMS